MLRETDGVMLCEKEADALKDELTEGEKLVEGDALEDELIEGESEAL